MDLGGFILCKINIRLVGHYVKHDYKTPPKLIIKKEHPSYGRLVKTGKLRETPNQYRRIIQGLEAVAFFEAYSIPPDSSANRRTISTSCF